MGSISVPTVTTFTILTTLPALQIQQTTTIVVDQTKLMNMNTSKVKHYLSPLYRYTALQAKKCQHLTNNVTNKQWRRSFSSTNGTIDYFETLGVKVGFD